MTDTHALDAALLAAPDPARGATLRKVALALIAAGGLLTALALFSDGGRSRAGFAYLMGFSFLWTIVVGSLFFVALQHATRSVWSVVLRRVAEMLAAPVWLVALLFLPVVLSALLKDSFSVFPWMDEHHVDGDHVLEGKAPYLNVPFWVLRTGLYFLVWVFFAGFFVRKSLRQDAGEGGVGATLRMRKWSGPFLILFGFTVTFASFDWLMSLAPHWFSTIYGVYVFAGMTLAGLAAITLGVVGLRSQGALGEGLVRRDHLYSLGGLLFAFTCFWAYIAFSQFMLIWYGNLPEETVFFIRRLENGWKPVTVLLAVLRFAVPFFLLLPRDAKSDPRRLVTVSVLVLLGQLLDLYWLIMPDANPAGPPLGWQELGPTLLLSGILALYLGLFLRRHRPVAVGDPTLEKSRHFHL